VNTPTEQEIDAVVAVFGPGMGRLQARSHILGLAIVRQKAAEHQARKLAEALALLRAQPLEGKP
jgi:hypothetical protein